MTSSRSWSWERYCLAVRRPWGPSCGRGERREEGGGRRRRRRRESEAVGQW